MKKIHYLLRKKLSLVFIICLLGFLFLSPDASGKKLQVFLTYSTFNSPESGPYVETYLSVYGNSVHFIPTESGKFKGSLQVIMIFKKGDEIVNFDKYELSSPELEDTTKIDFTFIDQQRYLLPNGDYNFEIQVGDINSETKPYISMQPLSINFPDNEVMVSGIQLLESYKKSEENSILSKSGYDLIPYVFNFYPEDINNLTFYTEIYNSNTVLGENEKYLLSYYIAEIDNDTPLARYVRYKKETTASVNVLLTEFNITDLPSGNYFLIVEAKSKENKRLGINKFFFQRSNPKIQYSLDDLTALNLNKTFAGRINNMDTLAEYVRCLIPISNNQEINFALAHLESSDIETLQKFFYKFWYERNQLEPEKEWLNYLNEVNKVNLAYSTSISKGYETDRGRAYLKYGPPNAISESYNEPSAYPYEIWHYYELKNGQRNKRFVFYTVEIATNDFRQVHSDVTGELANYRWQQVIYGRVDPGFNLDSGAENDGWGGNSKKYFDTPR